MPAIQAASQRVTMAMKVLVDPATGVGLQPVPFTPERVKAPLAHAQQPAARESAAL